MEQVKGLRIKDVNEIGIVVVSLIDILHEIKSGQSYYWSILYLESIGDLGNDINIAEFENNILNLESGLIIEWNDLITLSKKFQEILWINLIASKNKDKLHRYKSSKERYESFDITIEMVDSSYWEIFTKDSAVYNNLINKFKIEEYLDPDFQEKQ